VSVIDSKDYEKVEELIKNNNENIKCDIIYEMYIRSILSIDRFQFIMKYFSKFINISSLLIKKLFNDYNKNYYNYRNDISNRYLDVIFEHIKIYNNEFIKQLLFHYRNKVDISISDFNQYISDEKYKI